jgi:hypothetical protein
MFDEELRAMEAAFNGSEIVASVSLVTPINRFIVSKLMSRICSVPRQTGTLARWPKSASFSLRG